MFSKLLMMRHGESVWNLQNLFTGWVDVPLSSKGIQECMEGGKKLRNEPIDVIFTSTLIRAQMTVALALLDHSSGKIPVFQHPGDAWSKIHNETTQRQTIPVYMASELNERMYGKLQGLNKAETAKEYGSEQVQLWRRSFDVAPPEGESLEMTAKRTWPYFQKQVLPLLEKGQNVFIAAHGNSLRSILMHIQQLSPQEVVDLEIATGVPMIYLYEKGKWRAQ